MRKVLFFIVLISAFFRFHDLGTLPNWYWDEGINLNIASNLMHGKPQAFSLEYTFVPHPPLFFLTVLFMFKIFGVSILTIRMVTAIYGILTTIAIYLAGKEIFDEKIGLVASFLYAVCPAAIYWGRLGLANNQLVLLSVVSFLFIGRYIREKRKLDLYLALIVAGFSLITEYIGMATVVALVFLLWKYERKIYVNIISFIPFMLFIVLMLVLMPNAFLWDFLFQIKHFSVPLALALILFALLFALRNKIKHYYALTFDFLDDKKAIYYLFIAIWSVSYLPSEEMFHKGTTYFSTLGLATMFLMPGLLKGVKKSLLLSFFVSHFLILFTLNRADHMLIFLYPYLMLGISILMFRSLEDICVFLKRINATRPYYTVMPIVVFLPLAVGFYQATSTFVLEEGIYAQDLQNTYALVNYINDNTKPDDLVLTYSYFGHLVNARACPIIQSVAYNGVQVEYYSGDLKSDRFAFNCSYENAKLITVTDSLMESLNDKEEYADFLSHVENLTYERIGRYIVYKGGV